MVDGAALFVAVPSWNRYLPMSSIGLALTYSSRASPILPIVMPMSPSPIAWSSDVR